MSHRQNPLSSRSAGKRDVKKSEASTRAIQKDKQSLFSPSSENNSQVRLDLRSRFDIFNKNSPLTCQESPENLSWETESSFEITPSISPFTKHHDSTNLSNSNDLGFSQLPREVWDWLGEKDRSFYMPLRGLSSTAVLDLYNNEMRQRKLLSPISEYEDHDKDQNDSGNEFWLKITGIDCFNQSLFNKEPADYETIFDYIEQVDPLSTFPLKDRTKFLSNLLDKYCEWLEDESPSRDLTIYKCLKSLIPRFPKSVGLNWGCQFYSDLAKIFLLSLTKSHHSRQPIDYTTNTVEDDAEFAALQNKAVEQVKKLKRMRRTGYWNSDKLNRISEQVGKTSDVLDSWKVERKEVRFELDQFYDSHKKSCDKIKLLEKRNQKLTKDIAEMQSMNKIYLQMIENNSDRIAGLTAQMEKLAKFVNKLEK